LKKSFCGGGQNFLEPLMRFVRDDARDLVASQKNDHGLLYRRYGTFEAVPEADITKVSVHP
jgi:hypothetical protein